MENVLLKKFRSLTGGKDRCDDLDYAISLNAFRMREECTRKYAWAIPNNKAIYTLVKHSPIIEVGAGTGYWAALVRDAGGDIIAFDKCPPSPSVANAETKAFFNVQQAESHIAGKYPDRTLFLCWPPYDTSMAFCALKAYKGNTVIFVGGVLRVTVP